MKMPAFFLKTTNTKHSLHLKPSFLSAFFFFKGNCWLTLPVLCIIYTSSKHREISVGCKSEVSLLKGSQNHGMVTVGTDLRDHLRKGRDRMHLPPPEMPFLLFKHTKTPHSHEIQAALPSDRGQVWIRY